MPQPLPAESGSYCSTHNVDISGMGNNGEFDTICYKKLIKNFSLMIHYQLGDLKRLPYQHIYVSCPIQAHQTVQMFMQDGAKQLKDNILSLLLMILETTFEGDIH